MKITQEPLPKSQLGIRVEIPAADVAKRHDMVFRRLMKTVRLPGFRQGKVPAHVLRQYVGAEAIRFAVVEELLETTMPQALKEIDVPTIGKPSLREEVETLVRVPVLRAHSEAVNLEFTQPFPVAKAREILAQSPGVELVEDWQNNYFPMPINASGKDAVLVGRIRQDLSHPCGLDLWLCGDQIRKGAALNAVQIAEYLIAKGWLS